MLRPRPAVAAARPRVRAHQCRPRRVACAAPARASLASPAHQAASVLPEPPSSGAPPPHDPLGPRFWADQARAQVRPLAVAAGCLVFCTGVGFVCAVGGGAGTAGRLGVGGEQLKTDPPHPPPPPPPACNLASPLIAGAVFDSVITGATATAAGGAPPHTSGALASTLLTSRPRATLLAALAAVYAAEPLATRLYVSSLATAVEGGLRNARVALFRTLLAARVPFHDSTSPTSLATLLSSDLGTLRSVALAATSRDRGPRALAEAAGSVAVLCALSLRLGPVLAVVIVSAAASAALYRARARPVEAAAAAAAADLADRAADALASIRTVRTFRGEQRELASFSAAADASASAGVGFGAAKAALEALSRAAVHASLLSLYALGGALVATGALPPGGLLAAIGATYALVYATQGAVATAADARRAVAALARVREAAAGAPLDAAVAKELGVTSGGGSNVATTHAAHPPTTAVQAARAGAPLALADVSYTHPGAAAPSLSHVSLTLDGGKVTAVVGASGAGKSTLASLLARWVDPSTGAVTLGGVPASGFAAADWAAAVTLIGADSAVFAATAADNIAYGAPESSSASIVAAARAARAHDFIAALPDGYDTLLGRGGRGLSRGEAQRLAIARAFLKDAPILVLDEALSALDPVSEADVGAALAALATGRTVVTIAHAPSAAARADRVVVMDGGAVVEDGRHADLVAAGGAYARLVGVGEA